MNEEKIAKLDSALVQSSKKIKVLNALAWPAGEEEKFLLGWQRGNPQLPEINLAKPDVSKSISELEAISTQCNMEDPVERFLAETAESYATAGRMIQAIGKPSFTQYSSKIYGRPDQVYRLQGISEIGRASCSERV